MVEQFGESVGIEGYHVSLARQKEAEAKTKERMEQGVEGHRIRP